MTPILTQVHRNAIGSSPLASQRKGNTIRLDLISMIERMLTIARLPNRGAMIHIYTEENFRSFHNIKSGSLPKPNTSGSRKTNNLKEFNPKATSTTEQSPSLKK
jgi:hypothetical protein